MGREYTSAVEAIAAGSCCNIQLDLDIPAIPLPALPIIQLPKLPSLPTISFYCPCDDQEEQKLE